MRPEDTQNRRYASEVSLGDLKEGKEYIIVGKTNGIVHGRAVFNGSYCQQGSFSPTGAGFKTRPYLLLNKYYRFWEVKDENCEGRQFLSSPRFEKVSYSDLRIGDTILFTYCNSELYGKVLFISMVHATISHQDKSQTTIFPHWEVYREVK